jgi:hypothetical protein
MVVASLPHALLVPPSLFVAITQNQDRYDMSATIGAQIRVLSLLVHEKSYLLQLHDTYESCSCRSKAATCPVVKQQFYCLANSYYGGT